MSYTALARKWRPRRFEDLTGQEHVVRALSNALASGRVHHAFLFTGTRGVGKTTIARILAKCLNCETGVVTTPCGRCAACREIDEGRFVDLLEVDAASRTKVDDTRELLDNVQYAPARGRYKVYLIDEVHMLSGHSFNALLKTLEEPPPHVKFLLATTDPQKLPITVLSRCLQFNLKRIPVPRIAERMRQVLEAEGIPAEEGALHALARAADGSLRDALSLLDQLIAFGGGRVTLAAADAMLGTVDRQHARRMLEALASGDAAALRSALLEAQEFAAEPAELLDSIAAALARVALRQAVSDYAGDEQHDAAMLEELASRIAPEDVQVYYQIAVNGRRDLDWAPDAATGLEMTLLRMLAFRPVGEVGQDAEGTGRAGAQARAAPAQRSASVSNGASLGSSASASAAGRATAREPDAATAQGPAAGAIARDGAPALTPENWLEIVPLLGLTGPSRQLATHCALLAAEAGVARFALDPQGQHLRTAALSDKLAAALARYAGAPLRIEFAAPRDSAPIETPAAARARSVEAELEQARESIERDPTVRALREKFGARVRPDSVRPRR